MSQIVTLAIGSINQATAGYQQAYGEGLSLFSFDEERLEFRRIAASNIANPSFITVDPISHMIYATQELADEEEGQVSALSFSPQTGEIVQLNSQPTGGRIPAHNMITRDGRFLLVANYGSFNHPPDCSLSVLPILPDGRLDKPCDGVKIQGAPGPVQDRQQRPHAHMVLEAVENGTIWVADLGLDQLIRYRLNEQGKLNETGRLTMPAGSGPRHMTLHPSGQFLYVVGELDSTVSTFRQSKSGFELIQTLSTIENDVESYGAELHLSPDGRFLYISNRGEDSIACFAVEDTTGLLILQQIIASGGKTPRNFALTPSGQHLLAAHQNSEAITILRRDAQTGKLTPTFKTIAIAHAVCIKPFISEKTG